MIRMDRSRRDETTPDVGTMVRLNLSAIDDSTPRGRATLRGVRLRGDDDFFCSVKLTTRDTGVVIERRNHILGQNRHDLKVLTPTGIGWIMDYYVRAV